MTAIAPISNGESGASARGKVNEAFTRLEDERVARLAGDSDLQTALTAGVAAEAQARAAADAAEAQARAAADAKQLALSFDSDAAAYMLRAASPPTSVAPEIDELVRNLKTANLLPKFDALQVYANAGAQIGCLSLVAGGPDATPVNAPKFSVAGVTTDGAASYVATGFNPRVATRATLNQATLMLWVNGPLPSSPLTWLFESASGSGNQSILGAAGVFYGDLNTRNSSAANVSGVDLAVSGLYAVTREDSGHVAIYRNGALLARRDSAATAIPDGEFYVGVRYQTENTPHVSGFYAAATVGLFGYAGYMSASDHKAAYDVISNYMAKVGAYNLPLACWGDSLTQGVNTTPWPAQIATMFLPPRAVGNYGVSGQTSTQIKARCLADAASAQTALAIIWAGRNNLNKATVLADVAAMVAHQTNGKFLVLSIPNGAGEGSGTSTYATIMDINAALAAAYPANYVDVRAALIANYDPSNAQDVIDRNADLVPTSLRLSGDYLHPNTAGNAVIARALVGPVNTLTARPSGGGSSADTYTRAQIDLRDAATLAAAQTAVQSQAFAIALALG